MLRTAQRNKKPLTGRALRLVSNRRTSDGAFLTELVDLGLMTQVSGTATEPFAATSALTERGQHAAEYGESEVAARVKPIEPAPAERPKTVLKSNAGARGSK